MKALLEAMDSYGLYLHRVTQTQGIVRLMDREIEQMVEMCIRDRLTVKTIFKRKGIEFTEGHQSVMDYFKANSNRYN